MIRHNLPSGTIWEGDWTHAPLEGGYTMAEVDGPFGMKKAAWDRMNIDGLADWYAPHLARLTSLMAPSATVYLWNTAEGWARLDPVMRGLGWGFSSLVVWYKPNGQAQKSPSATGWPDVTEVCGVYLRHPDFASIIRRERESRGLSASDLAEKVVGSRSGAVWNWEDGTRHPTEENWVAMWQALNESGPLWVLPHCPRWSLQLTQTVRRATDAETRAEYQLLRPPFQRKPDDTNLWTHPQVSGAERLTGPDGQALHPCQKPLLFAERMVQASTRPGDRVLVPFGGTCRIATYLERLRRMEPENARYHDTCELNADGKDYLGAVLGRIGEDTGKAGQQRLFGGSK